MVTIPSHIKSILNNCVYALGEAVVNTHCARRMETRRDTKKQFKEDIELFEGIISEINEVLGHNHVQ